jgi:hypothetical protein
LPSFRSLRPPPPTLFMFLPCLTKEFCLRC